MLTLGKTDNDQNIEALLIGSLRVALLHHLVFGFLSEPWIVFFLAEEESDMKGLKTSEEECSAEFADSAQLLSSEHEPSRSGVA